MDGNRYKRQFYNPEKVVARFRSLTTPEPTTVAKNAGAFATSAKSASTEKKEPIVTSAPPAPVAVVKDTKPPVIHITSPEYSARRQRQESRQPTDGDLAGDG